MKLGIEMATASEKRYIFIAAPLSFLSVSSA
jgi:hypothetical protein